jgi:phytoene/squalene synthetase
VNVGLCRLFGDLGYEDAKFSSGALDTLANETALFLQKTNVIRDFLEDIVEEPPIMYWPREIWGAYAQSLSEFVDPQNRCERPGRWASRWEAQLLQAARADAKSAAVSSYVTRGQL